MKLERREYTTNSAEETRDLGKQLASQLQAGDVIALVGPLGAGKTQFVKGLATGLGVSDQRSVNSPTFVLVQEYHGRLTLYHLDAYRLGSVKELSTIGFDELCDAGGVVVVEWADKVQSLLPEAALCVSIAPVSESIRTIEISGGAIAISTPTDSSLRKSRKPSFLTWIASAISLIFLASWTWAGFSASQFTFRMSGETFQRFAVSDGCVAWLAFIQNQPRVSEFNIDVRNTHLVQALPWKLRFNPGPLLPHTLNLGGTTRLFIFPFWMPLFLSLTATALLWRRDRQRADPGHCIKCNYNLTKNVSGRCPECGEPIPSSAA